MSEAVTRGMSPGSLRTPEAPSFFKKLEALSTELLSLIWFFSFKISMFSFFAIFIASSSAVKMNFFSATKNIC